MEDLLESLVLPGLVVAIIFGTVVLARLDAKAQREIEATEGGGERRKSASEKR